MFCRGCLILAVFCCGWTYAFSQTQYNTIPVDDSTILLIEDQEYSQYELDKYLFRQQHSFNSDDKSELSPETCQSWVESFIDLAVLTFHAQNQGYDKKPSVLNDVNNMAKVQITQENGLLYSSVMEDSVSIGTNDIECYFNRNNKRMKIRAVRFLSNNHLASYVNQTGVMDTINNFERLHNAAKTDSFCYCGAMYMQWPFMRFQRYGNQLYSMSAGEVTPPLETVDGVWIISVDDIVYTDYTPSDVDYLETKIFLVTLEKERIWSQLLFTACDSMELEIDDNAVKNFWINFIDKRKPSKDICAVYSFDCKRYSVTNEDIIRFYNRLLFPNPIRHITDCYILIKKMAFEKYALALAEERGITSSVKFLLDRKNYKNSVMHNMFVKEQLREPIVLSDNYLEQIYEENRDTYREPAYHDVDVYTFLSLGSANEILQSVENLPSDEVREFIENADVCKEIMYDVKVEHNNGNKLLFNVASHMTAGSWSDVLPFNNTTLAIVHKNSDGPVITIPFQDVKEEIRRQETERLVETKRRELVTKLRKQYTIIDNIDREAITAALIEESGMTPASFSGIDSE